MRRQRSNLWVIVLAGGSGRRLAHLTGGVPKQFWSIDGGTTLLEDTLERVAPLAPFGRTVVVAGRTHRPMVEALDGARGAVVLYQPRDRGTAAGVCLGLMPAFDSRHDPIVLLTPSDHGVRDAAAFRVHVLRSVAWVRRHPGQIALFGVEPSAPDAGYGWIEAEARGAGGRKTGFRAVASFVEKPPPERAADLMVRGAFWNTMVLVARASTLCGAYARHAPELWATLNGVLHFPAATRESYLEHVYFDLPPADFCRDVLAPAGNLWVSVWPRSMGWSDLGTPDRVRRWRTLPGGTRVDPAPPGEGTTSCHESQTTNMEVTL